MTMIALVERQPRIVVLVACDDGELWAKKDTCSVAIAIVISKN